MTSNNDLQLARLAKDYEERLRSLREDRYALRHSTLTANFAMSRLVHMANGNDITLLADFQAMTLTQKTNNIRTHYQTYRDD